VRALFSALVLLTAGAASAADKVTLVGSVQTALGCTDGQLPCAGSELTYDAADDVWQKSFTLPAGTHTFRAALNDGTGGTYGASGQLGGTAITLELTASTQVKFFYDDKSHWITSNRNAVVAVAPGNFQSELGCPGDWQPDCLRSMLQDVDGDGTYTLTTTALPAGNYEGKVAINEGWDENYGEGGARGGGNIGFAVPASNMPVKFSYKNSTHVLTITVEGAPVGDIQRARGYWLSGEWLVWDSRAELPDNAVFTLHHEPAGAMTLGPTGIVGGQSVSLTRETVGLPLALQQRFPHLLNKPVLRIADQSALNVRQVLKGQVLLSVKKADGTLVDASAVQLPGVLDALYANDSALGPTWNGTVPTLRVWAPTARNVKLLLFDTADTTATPSATVPMTWEESTGVWSATGEASWKNKFYLYEVEVFFRGSGVVTNRVTDPYSLSLSLNSKFSQLVDLNDAALKPTGWDTLQKPVLEAPEDVVLYELHVRDFSISDTTVPASSRGTFLAFTEQSSNGMKHLRRLAQKGLTHVHLLPVFDIATINEDRSQQRQPAGNLAAMAPDSEEQQAAVNAVRDTDGFNWGYDPYHYTVPEGSYSTDPNGSARLLQFRQMVQSLAGNGLRVVMDVVYNHTNSSGLADQSVLDKVVPGYYHRLNPDGNVETSTCCQNTATEHAMMEKLMVDSLVTWAKAYKVDGFRFDLMGHHMKANMLKVKERLQSLTVANDGVDGSKIYIYGEGWNFGEVANNARGVNATQLNMPGTGIGTFSDRLRDAARGGGPFSGLQEQGFISGLWYDSNTITSGSEADQRARLLHYMDQIRVGLAGNLANYELISREGTTVKGSQVDYNGQPGGYTEDPQEVITYVSAHDNETLFDAVQLKAPSDASIDTRVRMHQLGLSLVALGQGIPFFHAGDEMLRSKSLDRNSYNSGDWFNKLDFSYQSNNWGVGLPPAADNQTHWPIMKALLARPELKPSPLHITRTVDHFEELLSIRKSSSLFRQRTAADIQQKVRFHNTGPSQEPGVIVMSITDEQAAARDDITHAVIVFNASDELKTVVVEDFKGRGMQLHPVQRQSTDTTVRGAGFGKDLGAFSVPARTTAVFVSEAEAPDEGGCGGCSGGGSEAFGAFALLLGGLARRRRPRT
jgi:pullulanase-type alpha-1,6-glucosidase